MTVLTGLSSERKLAGLAVLSGWTPMRNTLKAVSRGTSFYSFAFLGGNHFER